MRYLIYLVVGGLGITLLVLASGCGSSVVAPTITVSQEAQLYLIGDGLLGGGNDVAPAQATPGQLQLLLDAARSPFTVINKTKTNDTVLGILDKIDRYLADARPKDTAILVAGFQDAKNAQDLTKVTENLIALVEKLQDKKMNVILIQLTDELGVLPVEVRTPFAQVYVDASTQTKVPLISGIFEELRSDDASVATDEFHLSAQGNKLLAQKLFDLISK